ncbi:universal stress protein (plasmid) [Photobacterium sp. GJ3]|uniref:universal stress protein n=1 Tax=Photobacterium sp. GJ3 TaxID=2829502 RepID=UPI001B8CB97A|nr:universal stress protein [Photobacterium sp. GJ3]QUJ70365.1 universal stress protein [Photobacterium sp. GJ3]
MHNFRNMLYISDGIQDETQGLQQALSLADAYQSPLTVLIVYPALPETLGGYQSSWEQALVHKINEAMTEAKALLPANTNLVVPSIRTASSPMPSTLVIQHVIRESYDLVIKHAELAQPGSGLKALDMELLRQCPCPVWLCRPMTHAQNKVHVAVAIDAENDTQSETDLDIELLQTARQLSNACDQKLIVISSWDFPYDEIASNPFIHVPDAELEASIQATEARHIERFQALVAQSGIQGEIKACHPKGLPEQCIPATIAQEGVELLVMGTVARTGIPGFIMGNTAEDIVQNTQCSILALKPKGFVSDIKPY